MRGEAVSLWFVAWEECLVMFLCFLVPGWEECFVLLVALGDVK